jgi:hypothetical protein
MKNSKLLVVCFIAFITLAFSISKKGLNAYLLKNDESISFSNKPLLPNSVSSFLMNKRAFDGSGYKLNIDTANNIRLSTITQATGPTNDEFTVVGCTGNLTRTKEKVTFNFEKVRKNYYLIDLKNSKLIDVFDSIIRISLKSADNYDKPCEFYCPQKKKSVVYIRSAKQNLNDNTVTNSSNIVKDIISLVAVPKNITKDDLFCEVHKENSLAHFSDFEIVLKNGKVLKLPKGTYMLCEGNSFALN